MSDPSNQRADGCSVFFTIIILGVLLSVFYVAHKFFEPESPAPVTQAVDSMRRAKVADHRVQSDAFVSAIDQFHKERNSTLEDSMHSTLSKYKSSLRSPQNQTK
jgi:hypothetical protein